MKEADFGKRDKLGYWKPFKRIEYPPLFTTPVKPVAIAKWLFGFPGYLLPWNLLYAAAALAVWFFFTPPIASMRSLSVGWIAYLLVRNAAIVLVVYGAWHARLYVQKAQGSSFKFNAKWPSNDNDAFLFRRQNIDNVIWTFGSALPVWTGYEVLFYWAFAITGFHSSRGRNIRSTAWRSCSSSRSSATSISSSSTARCIGHRCIASPIRFTTTT